mmetsp:Transcript_24713/g.51280  ORF Transcript_24713/g.51280 Transcript_24713/m.51280 type:complete len:218 (-) Transcript_24713:6658-7311(-)
MRPKLVLGVFDQFNEGNEQSPWMWALSDETLQQNTSDLFLNSVVFSLVEEIQHDARKIMRVTRRVTELIRDSVEAQIPSMIVKFHQLLKHIHFWRTPQATGNLIVLKPSKALDPHIENQRIDFRRVHLILALLAKKRNHFGKEIGRLLISQISIQVRFEHHQWSNYIREDKRALRYFRKSIDFEVTGNRVVKRNTFRDGGKNEVSKLNAILRDDIAE